MSFHEVRFPVGISLGSSGGPERRTEIVSLSNGFEERNSPWIHSRRRYDAGIGLRSLDDLHEVLSFFEARRGRLYGFRWRDWSDYKSCAPGSAVSDDDQPIGTGDGSETRFKLTRRYVSGGEEYVRPISKPAGGSVRVAVDGAPQSKGSDFTLGVNTGFIEFTAPPLPGQQITAGFEFDVPVRFDTDVIEISLAAFEAGEIPSIPIIEVRV